MRCPVVFKLSVSSSSPKHGNVNQNVTALDPRLAEAIASGTTTLARRGELLLEILIDDVALPPPVVTGVDGFLSAPSAEALRALQRAVVRCGVWNTDMDAFVALVADLAAHGELNDVEAAHALASVPYPERDALRADAEELVAAADLVVEDKRDGFMEINDDDLFGAALRRFLAARNHDGAT